MSMSNKNKHEKSKSDNSQVESSNSESQFSVSSRGRRERSRRDSGSVGERVVELTETGIGSTHAIPEGKDAGESPPSNYSSPATSKVSITSSKKSKKHSHPKVKQKQPKDFRPLTICLNNCRYEILRTIAQMFDLLEVGEDEAGTCSIYWTDNSVSLEQVMNRRRFQLINHFPGMDEICHKDLLSRNLNRMKSLFPLEYDIFPKTWHLPAELGSLKLYAQEQKTATFICKPDVGCQGQGIFLLRNAKEFNPLGPKMICQVYVSKPFLIDSFKFDLRIYVLVTSVDPLRIYVHKEGLARFATEKYRPPTATNAQNSYMHLTNYSVNKHSQNFVTSDQEEDFEGKEGESKGGSKRKLDTICKWLESRSYNTKKLLQNIDDVIIKTIISAHPTLKHYYRICYMPHDLFATSACFQVLGFDILLDYKLKPYVLEVNHSPSFHTDTKVDEDVKTKLLKDTFTMLNLKRRRLFRGRVEHVEKKLVQKRGDSKKPSTSSIISTTPRVKGKEEIGGSFRLQQEAQFEYEINHSGSYRLIYPPGDKKDKDKYSLFFEQSRASLYHELGTVHHVKPRKSRKSTAAAQPSKHKLKPQHKSQDINSIISIKNQSQVSKSGVLHPNLKNPSSVAPSESSLGKVPSSQNTKNKAKAKAKETEKLQKAHKKTSHSKTKGQAGSKNEHEKEESQSISSPSSGSFKAKTTNTKKKQKKAGAKFKTEKSHKKKVKSTSSSSSSKSDSNALNDKQSHKTKKTKKKEMSPKKSNTEKPEQETQKRDTVIRDLGIDFQVLNLFKSSGSLKPEDEKSFKAKHGFFKATISTQNSRPDFSNTTPESIPSVSETLSDIDIELGTTPLVSKKETTKDQNY